jgi:hypothetical protein
MVQSVITNEIMKKALRYSGKVGVLASEEEDVPMSVAGNNDKYKKGARSFRSQFNSDVLIEETGGKYVAVFDPLDGSSNVDAGIPTGTIFGIFENDPSNLVGTPLSYIAIRCHTVFSDRVLYGFHCTVRFSFHFISSDRYSVFIHLVFLLYFYCSLRKCVSCLKTTTTSTQSASPAPCSPAPASWRPATACTRAPPFSA